MNTGEHNMYLISLKLNDRVEWKNANNGLFAIESENSIMEQYFKYMEGV